MLTSKKLFACSKSLPNLAKDRFCPFVKTKQASESSYLLLEPDSEQRLQLLSIKSKRQEITN